MKETRKEYLSALIDGEASEVEVHRLVREFSSDETLAKSWAIYQHIRSTVRTRGEARNQLTLEGHQVLFNRISEAIAVEDEHDAPTVKTYTPRNIVMGGLALAAMLVLAVFIGVQDPAGEPPIVAGNSAEGASVADVRGLSASSGMISPTSALVELDEEKQRRLRAYLNQHDRMARMDPNAQLVNYQDKSLGQEK